MRTPLGGVTAFATDVNVIAPAVPLSGSAGCRLLRAGRAPSTCAVAVVAQTVVVWCTQTGEQLSQTDLAAIVGKCPAAAAPVLAVDVWCANLVAVATAAGVILIDIAGVHTGCVRFAAAAGCRSARFGMAHTPATAVLFVASAAGVGTARVAPAVGMWAEDLVAVSRVAQPRGGRAVTNGIGAWPSVAADGVWFRASGTDVVVAASATARGLAIATTIGTEPTRHYVVRGDFVDCAVAASPGKAGAEAAVLSLTRNGVLAVHMGPDWRPRGAVAADPSAPVWLDHCWPVAPWARACSALGAHVVQLARCSSWPDSSAAAGQCI